MGSGGGQKVLKMAKKGVPRFWTGFEVVLDLLFDDYGYEHMCVSGENRKCAVLCMIQWNDLNLIKKGVFFIKKGVKTPKKEVIKEGTKREWFWG